MRGMRIEEHRRARALRQASTSAEGRLWRSIRGRGLKGHKFVRQEPIGPYFVDFVCRVEKLVVEVDGATHGTAEEVVHDRRRTAFLEENGYRVIRVQNADVYENLAGVLEVILSALERRSTL